MRILLVYVLTVIFAGGIHHQLFARMGTGPNFKPYISSEDSKIFLDRSQKEKLKWFKKYLQDKEYLDKVFMEFVDIYELDCVKAQSEVTKEGFDCVALEVFLEIIAEEIAGARN